MSNGGSVFHFDSANSPFPSGDLYVDTNSWRDIEETRIHGPATEKYLFDYLSQDRGETPIILWSPQNTSEVIEGIEVVAYQNEALRLHGNKRKWKDVANAISVFDANILHQDVQSRYDTLVAKFKENIYEIETDSDIMPTARKIASLYGIQIKDAKHLAYMWHQEVNNLVTRDKRFALVPGINIFSPEMNANGGPLYSIDEFMTDLPEELKE